MENNLIVVKQLPIIEDQLRQVKTSVDERVAQVLALACTEATYKDVKKARAELNKEFQDLEARRREVKKAILAFYNEYRASLNIPEDIAPFDRCGINITMSDSLKKLQGQASLFLQNVSNDLRMIETLEHKDEVLVEYRKSLSAPEAALIVDRRHKEMEEAARRRAAMKSAQDIQEAAQAKIEEVLNEEPPAPVSAPAEQPIPTEVPAEKIYQVSFRVRGSIDKLKALKEFLVNGGYDYEQF